MNDTIETLGIFDISGLPTMVLGNGVAAADALKKHERVNAFNLVIYCAVTALMLEVCVLSTGI